jgi:hypothetical protein
VRCLDRPATSEVKGIDVATAPDLSVGYVMDVGGTNPAGIAQLGCTVTLLDERLLASADLKAFAAIVTGTRAYAVREDLKTYNRRLLDYVKDGGNVVVLYNTQELVPDTFAPFSAQHSQRAEEVTEEDSPVNILAPEHQALNWPTKIAKADFDGWVEQRGSKFWAGWDPAYTPIIESWDTGQAPQKGGWLHARYGKGHYTYSRTPSTGNCPTACRARTGSWPTCWRYNPFASHPPGGGRARVPPRRPAHVARPPHLARRLQFGADRPAL